jgi:hypothetical protein
LEHLDEIVVKGVVKLTLEVPLELWAFEVAWMNFEIVGVHRDWRVLELDDDLDGVILLAGVEGKQRVLVLCELVEHALKAGRHEVELD